MVPFKPLWGLCYLDWGTEAKAWQDAAETKYDFTNEKDDNEDGRGETKRTF